MSEVPDPNTASDAMRPACPMCGAPVDAAAADCPSCGEAIPVSPGIERPPRFRWRFIPTALLTVFGGFMVLAGFVMIPMAIYDLLRPGRLPGPPLAVAGLVNLIGGSAWLLAARWCWEKHWLRFTFAFIFGYLLMGIAAALNRP